MRTLDSYDTRQKTNEPIVVGNCGACGGEMYDYELTECKLCGLTIHTGCVKTCKCGQDGCSDCLVEDEETGDFACGEWLSPDKPIKQPE